MSGTIEWVQEELDRFHGERLAEWGKGRCWLKKKKGGRTDNSRIVEKERDGRLEDFGK